MHFASSQRKFAGDECFERITHSVLTWKLKMIAEDLVLVQFCKPIFDFSASWGIGSVPSCRKFAISPRNLHDLHD